MPPTAMQHRARPVASPVPLGSVVHVGPARLAFAASLTAAALAAMALAGCSDEGDSCGPGEAPIGDVVVTDTGASGAVLRFHQLRARPNNDCPAADAPAGVVSLTISGVLVGAAAPFTLCISRPDLLLDGPRPLGATGSPIELVDVVGSDAGCTYRQARNSSPSGSLTASGVCGNGRDPAGFALRFAGELSVERTCGATIDTLRMSVTGEVAVSLSDS